MTSKRGEGGHWDKNTIALFLLLGTSSGGIVIGGAGQSKVAEQLEKLGRAVEQATAEIVDQRRAHEEFKLTTDRRMSEVELRLDRLELTMRKSTFK